MSKNSADRFYLMSFKSRPVFWGDIGSNLRIEGLVVSGEDRQAILLLPGCEYDAVHNSHVIHVSTEDWSEFIRFSDDPQILTDLNRKIFQRKLRYAISGEVQQKVWAADGFRCRYCGAKMGERLLTIDHFIPLELGGANDTTNYLTACKKCNKNKGNTHPKDWDGLAPLYYIHLVNYLKNRKLN
jgi:hypothetical protein